MRRFLFPFFIALLTSHSTLWAGEDGGLFPSLPRNRMCVELYAEIFHGVPTDSRTVTSSRKERRRTVTADRAEAFIQRAQGIAGERWSERDLPPDANTEFITSTDYLPRFEGTSVDGEKIHKARIRIREYFAVPTGTTPREIRGKTAKDLTPVKLADGAGPFVKLEFKVGKPTVDADGNPKDTDLVVDKPGIVMSREDVNLLTSSVKAFQQNREKVIARTQALTLTSARGTQLINYGPTVQEMVDRIGLIHEVNTPQTPVVLAAQTNMQYKRRGYKVLFNGPQGKKVEVQITVDQDVTETALKSGLPRALDPNYRVVELKIPVEYADLSAAELAEIGLGDLARLREEFMSQQEVPKAQQDASKPSNLDNLQGDGPKN